MVPCGTPNSYRDIDFSKQLALWPYVYFFMCTLQVFQHLLLQWLSIY